MSLYNSETVADQTHYNAQAGPAGTPPSPPPETDNYEYGTLTRAAMGIANVPGTFVDDLVSLGEDVTGWITGDKVEWFDVPQTIGEKGWMVNTDLGTAGEVTEQVGTFALGLLLSWTGIGEAGLLGQAGKLGKVGKLAEWASKAQAGELGRASRLGIEAIKGAGVDFALSDTKDGNLSNLLNEFPMLKDTVVTYLKHDGDDSQLMKRMKNAMEGIPLGIATDYLFEGLSKILKYKRAGIDAAAEGDEAKLLQGVERETGLETAPVDRNISALSDITPKPLTHQDEALEATEKPVATTLKEDMLMTPEGRQRTLLDIYDHIKESGMDAPLKAFENFTHVESPEEVEKLLAGVKEITGRGIQFDELGNRIPVRTLAETDRLSDSVPKELLSDLGLSMDALREQGRVMNNMDVYLTGWYKVLNAKANEAVRLAGRITDGNADALEKAQFLKLLEFQMEAQPYLQDIRAGIGRSLSAHRINISGSPKYLSQVTKEELEDPSAGFLKNKLKEILDERGGDKGVSELAKIIRDQAQVNSKGEVQLKDFLNTARSLQGSKWLNVLQEFRLTNILSGLSTQGVNVLGNSLAFMVRDLWEQGVAAGIGAFRSGKDRVYFSEVLGRAQSIGESLKDFFSTLAGDISSQAGEKGWLKALAGAGDSVNRASLDWADRATTEGIVSKAISSKYLNLDPHMPLGWVVDQYGRLARSVSFGAMNVTDAAAVHMGFYSELSALLQRHCLMNEITEQELWKGNMKRYVLDYARRGTMPKGVPEKTCLLIQQFYDDAMHQAKVDTFKDALDPSGLAGNFSRWLNQKDSYSPQLMKTFVVPFFRTPMNILEFVKARTPLLHKAAKDYQYVMEHGTQAQKDQITARVITGSLCYMGATGLYFSGALTGAHDPKERDDLLAAGVPEYAVKIGDRFYCYNRVDPLGCFLGIAADALGCAKYMKDGEYGAMSATLVTAAVKTAIGKSYMKGIGDLYNAASSPAQFGEQFAKGQLRSLIPMAGAQKTVNDTIDPNMKEARNMVDFFRSNTVLKHSLPNRKDSLGEEIPVESSPLSVMLGIKTSTYGDAVHREIAKYRLYPPDAPGTVRGVRLDDSQYQQYKGILHELGMDTKLNELVSSQGYRQMPDEGRATMLQHYLGKYREYAANLLTVRDSRLRTDIVNKQKFVLDLMVRDPQRYASLADDLQGIRDYHKPKYELTKATNPNMEGIQ